jgi:1-acyl-sn-glycerol-3-phosphate acyltransferase
MAASALGSPLRAFVRLALYGGFTFPIASLQRLAMALGLPIKKVLPLVYHKQCCRILGIKIDRRGRQSRRRPTLYVANHVSYLDISVLGALIQGAFVAKSEVRSWPLFGFLATLQDTIFVARIPLRTARHRDEMACRLAAGQSLILFPEGTSGDGNRVLPFRSALFSVARSQPGEESLVVQPVSIAYTKLDDLPLGRYLRPLCAWYGDMDLAPHLWQLAGLGPITVVVRFHSPVTLSELGSRKALANHCQDEVARGVAAALTGRKPRPALPGGAEATESYQGESQDTGYGTEATA